MSSDKYDVVIVGSGIAGLYSALSMDSSLQIAIMTKDKANKSNSSLAQGGIAACMSNSEDHLLSHINDTYRAGCQFNDRVRVDLMVREAKEHINRLVDYDTMFDRDINGELMSTKEGGHSVRRVLHSKDETGKEIIRALIKAVEKRPNIVLFEEAFVLDLMVDNANSIRGVSYIKDDRFHRIVTSKVVLATGGIGQVYKNSTNMLNTTGDGLAMAYRVGAKIMNMEFIQFHPTALYSKKDGKKFLITEALRGEGAILRNINGVRFMDRYHKDQELAPRDIVASAIQSEILKTDAQFVYLDSTHINSRYLKTRFPNIYDKCLSNGIDITKDMIPVVSVQHYCMGGIQCDVMGRTNIKGLYTCGEVACTNVHGANRLASNSLLEGLVFGNRVAIAIGEDQLSVDQEDYNIGYKDRVIENRDVPKLVELHNNLQSIMTKDLFIKRNINDIRIAKEKVNNIIEGIHETSIINKEYYEVLNIATVCKLIIEGAEKRNHSLGCHIIGGSIC